MKTHTSILMILFLFFGSCNGFFKKGPGADKDTASNSWPTTDTVGQNLNTGDTIITLIPYSENPMMLRDNKFYYDSLVPYFKYKNVERLDLFCNDIHTWYYNDLKELVFTTKFINTPYLRDTFLLGTYQFLLGNLKVNRGQSKTFIVLDYTEEWGNRVILVSVDKNHNIKDMEELCYSGADDAGFTEVKLTYKDKMKYSFIRKQGYQTFTKPIDTLVYTKTTGFIKLLGDGVFDRQTIRVQNNVTETNKVK